MRGELVRSVPINDPLGQTRAAAAGAGSVPGAMARRSGRSSCAGRFPTVGHSQPARDRVVVLGNNAARRLGITNLDQAAGDLHRRPPVPGDRRSSGERRRTSLAARLGHDSRRHGAPRVQPRRARLGTDRDRRRRRRDDRAGGAERRSARATRSCSVAAPPDPKHLRGQVQNDLNALFLLLGGVSLLVGALGIANVTLVSVLERVGEIGLRRALGASRRHIASQFLIESTVMGLLGGSSGRVSGSSWS